MQGRTPKPESQILVKQKWCSRSHQMGFKRSLSSPQVVPKGWQSSSKLVSNLCKSVSYVFQDDSQEIQSGDHLVR